MRTSECHSTLMLTLMLIRNVFVPPVSPYLQPLHLGDLVFDPILQGRQDLHLPVDPDLHVHDPLTEILGQVVVVVVVSWWKKTRVRANK